jgi:hypothetical protein
LVFTLEKLKIGEPLRDSVTDFCSTRFVLVQNNRDVCIDSFKICLLAIAGHDCLVEIVPNQLPGTGAVSQ